MAETLTHRADALDAVWTAWVTVGRTIDDHQWATASRCDGWSVAALYAHAGMFPAAVLDPPAVPDDLAGSEPVTAVAILRGFNVPGGVADELAGQVATAGASTAAGRSGVELVVPFADLGPRAVTALHGREGTATVPWPGAAALTTWGEAVRIVLMESVVHLLDVLDALGRRADEVPGPGLTETVRLLAELAEPVGFIEAATGRGTGSVLPVLR